MLRIGLFGTAPAKAGTEPQWGRKMCSYAAFGYFACGSEANL